MGTPRSCGRSPTSWGGAARKDPLWSSSRSGSGPSPAPGYKEVPRWVIDGYSAILWEVSDELGRRGEEGPTLVVVQIGVGAFAAAVTRHFRSPAAPSRPRPPRAG